MDPVSITASSISIVGGAVQLIKEIVVFIRTFRDAREDLSAVVGQLSQLKITLDLLRDESSTAEDALPADLKAQILSSLSSCTIVMGKLRDVLGKYRGKTGAISWALWGKDQVKELSGQLSTHSAALSVALELSTLAITKKVFAGVGQVQSTSSQIANTTTAIHQDTNCKKSDLARVFVEIESLRDLMAAGNAPPGQSAGAGWVERYLDSVSTYAGTVCDDVAWSDDERDTILSTPVVSEPQLLWKSAVPLKHDPNTSGSSIPAFEIEGRSASFVPHQDMVAVTGDGMVAFYKVPSGTQVSCITVPDFTSTTWSKPPQFSPDGSLFALIVDSGDAVYVDKTPQVRQRGGAQGFTNPQTYETRWTAEHIAFSSNNRQMAIGSLEGEIDFFDRDREAPRFASWTRLFNLLSTAKLPSDNLGSELQGIAIAGKKLVCAWGRREIRGSTIETGARHISFHDLIGRAVTFNSSWAITHTGGQIRFHQWDGELAESHWSNSTTNGQTIVVQEILPSNRYVSMPGLDLRYSNYHLDRILLKGHVSDARLDNTINMVRACGKYLFAVCRLDEYQDFKTGDVEIWNPRKKGVVCGAGQKEALVRSTGKQFRCPSFSTDAKHLLVKVLGTPMYEVWKI